MSVNKFGGAFKRKSTAPLSESDIAKVVDRKFITHDILTGDFKDYNAQMRRITHIAEPLEDTDAVNKKFVMDMYSTLLNGSWCYRDKISISTEKENKFGYLTLIPTGGYTYQFPRDGYFKILDSDFYMDDISIHLNGILLNIGGGACVVKEKDQLSFKLKNPNIRSKRNIHLDIFVSAQE